MAKFSKEELREINRLLKANAELTEKMHDNFSSYLQVIKAIGQEQTRINHLENQSAQLAQRVIELEEQRKNFLEEELELEGEALTAAIARRNAVENTLRLTRATATATQTQLGIANQTLQTLTQQANQVNAMTLGYNQIGQVWNKLPSLGKKFYGWIKGFEALEMSKEIKKAELSMGILSNQSKFFGKTMANASKGTQQLGVSVSDLANAQRNYADEVGRGVMLSEEELQAIAEIGKGTMLGMDGAVGMAAAMENFGLSVDSARDGVQETVDIAHKMGVNANSAVKELGKTLQLAQRYHFKGGVKGMASMANYAALVKMDLQGAATMADKAFRPEGAVEMSARLATMGGQMARLGDPFTLMFKARNDFEGFARDLGDATAEFAQFNKETGEFDITGLQLDRIREIGEITGVGAENMAEMAKQSAKFNMLKSKVNFAVSDEDRDMIAHMAKFDKDSNDWVVQFDGREQLLRDINAADLERFRAEEKSLKERAEQAQTFDESFNNLVMQFKTMALPFVDALNKGLVKPMLKFQEMMKDEEVLDTIRDLGESIGGFIGAVGGFVLEFPRISMAIAAGGTIFFNAGKWFANGQILGMGFNSVAGVGGGGGMMNMMPGGKGMRVGGKMMKNGRMLKGAGTFMKGAGKFAAPLALAGLGIDGYLNANDQSLSGGQAFTKTLDQNKLMALGAMIGMVGGPAGMAVGAGIGGIADFALASMREDEGLIGDYPTVNDGIIKFNPQDKFLKMNDGLVASTDKGKIDDIAKTSSNDTPKKIEFGDLKINGKIQLDIPNGTNMDIDLGDNPFFIRELTKLIQEQLRTNLAGGKLNPNPM